MDQENNRPEVLAQNIKFVYQNSILSDSVIVVDLKSHSGIIDSVSTVAKEFYEIEFYMLSIVHATNNNLTFDPNLTL